jgi:hypothetical protein
VRGVPTASGHALLLTHQAGNIGAILRRDFTVRMHDRLVGNERLPIHEARTHTIEHCHRIAKAVVRPRAAAGVERSVYLSIFVTGEKCDFKTNAPALVARIPIFARLGAVLPRDGVEKCGQAEAILNPDGNVDIGVRTRDSTDVEIDGPPTEEPVGQIVLGEQLVELRQGGELVGGGGQARYQ